MPARGIRWGLAAVVLATPLLAGCVEVMTRRIGVEVDLDPDLRGKTVSVDLVGVSGTEETRWTSKSLDEYWTPGDTWRARAIRRGIIHEMRFGQGYATTQTLGPGNPIWETWNDNGAASLVLLADVPGFRMGARSGGDARRAVIPIDADRWATRTVHVSVDSEGIRIRDDPLPEGD